MAAYSELENILKRYIDSGEFLNSAKNADKLRELLRNESVNHRYDLLINIRGFSTWTGLHEATFVNDLQSIKCMLDGFSCDKKYDVLKIQTSYGDTPLRWAALRGNSSIITYLMTDLSQQQKYDILQIQNTWGNTALHEAASKNNVEAYRAILASVPYHLLLELLNIENNAGRTAEDIRPEITDEPIVLFAKGL